MLLKYIMELTSPLQVPLHQHFPNSILCNAGVLWENVHETKSLVHSCSWTTWSLTHIVHIHHSNMCAVPADLLQWCLNSVLAGYIWGRNAFDHWTWHHTERKALKKNCSRSWACYLAIFSIKISFISIILLYYLSRCLLGFVCMSKAQKGSVVLKVWETLLYSVLLCVFIS